jgi:hypothetical protein
MRFPVFPSRGRDRLIVMAGKGSSMMAAPARDRAFFDSLSQTFARIGTESAGERILAMGRFFLGAPYGAGTLERQGPEETVIDLRRFDCFTFVETVVALVHSFYSGPAFFDRYRDILTLIRYRGGRRDGYASRLHYFSDWLYDNERKGIIGNISRILDGQPFEKKINYMTGHPDQYPALKNRDVYRQMRDVERRMQRRMRHYIPKAMLKNMEGRIADGDLIAFTSTTEGLDCAHVGIAVRVEGGLHLLHASSAAGGVIVSRETLDRYLDANEAFSGIMVARMAERAGGPILKNGRIREV